MPTTSRERFLQGFLGRAGNVLSWQLAAERYAGELEYGECHDLATVRC